MTRIPRNWGRKGSSGEYGMGPIWFVLGCFIGVVFTLVVVVQETDVDTPVANEPKCETIIIHR